LDLGTVARIWRGGCIIRAALLEQIQAAYRRQSDLPNLLLDLQLGQELMQRQDSLRVVVCMATQLGLPTPAFTASLAYWDSYRSAWLPANLIQALRDCFGAHGYERTDRPGIFHTDWRKP
jgi:6-phosphogluconate dehydrogenase